MQVDFGEAWLEVVAAGCDVLHGRPTTLDLEKADIELVWPGEFEGFSFPAVKVQVKTTKSLRRNTAGDFCYDLDVTTYNILRRNNHTVPRFLAVIEVSAHTDRLRLEDEGTLLLGRGAWTSPAGLPPTTAVETQVVTLPAGNTLDRGGLTLMRKNYSDLRNSVVPEVEVWENG